MADDPVAPAELTWALIMAAFCKLPQYSALLKQGAWQTSSLSLQHNTLERGLRRRALGLWAVGCVVAQYARAFGVRVWGSEASRAQAGKDGVTAGPSKQALFCEADVLSLHLRFSESTGGIIGAEDFALMKPHAFSSIPPMRA
jgi:D-3-phosphoglycerate dehydrogenase